MKVEKTKLEVTEGEKDVILKALGVYLGSKDCYSPLSVARVYTSLADSDL